MVLGSIKELNKIVALLDYLLLSFIFYYSSLKFSSYSSISFFLHSNLLSKLFNFFFMFKTYSSYTNFIYFIKIIKSFVVSEIYREIYLDNLVGTSNNLELEF